MMKYNLGATQIAPTLGLNSYENGLVYQWGRKDPFLNAKGNVQLPDASLMEPVKGEDYFIDATNGAPDFLVGNKSKVITSDGSATVNTSIANPMTFYKENGVSGDWLAAGTQAIVENNDLWGNPGPKSYNVNKDKGTKSMFDPCPTGYMTPPRYILNRSDNYRTDGTCIFVANGMIYNNGTVSAFYPANGFRYYTNGTFGYVGQRGTTWTSSPGIFNLKGGVTDSNVYAGDAGFRLDGNEIVTAFDGTRRANGYTIRCCAQ
jgi:hypothetical protein